MYLANNNEQIGFTIVNISCQLNLLPVKTFFTIVYRDWTLARRQVGLSAVFIISSSLLQETFQGTIFLSLSYSLIENSFSVFPTFPQRALQALSFLPSNSISKPRLWLVGTRCLGNSRIQ